MLVLACGQSYSRSIAPAAIAMEDVTTATSHVAQQSPSIVVFCKIHMFFIGGG